MRVFDSPKGQLNVNHRSPSEIHSPPILETFASEQDTPLQPKNFLIIKFLLNS